MDEQNAIQEQNFKQSKEQKEQRRLLEDKKNQLAVAQQTILQMSTEKAQKMILSNKAERLIANSPMMFRCSDCFERLYVTAKCAYETPNITQLDTQSIKTTAVSKEHSLSLSAIAYGKQKMICKRILTATQKMKTFLRNRWTSV